MRGFDPKTYDPRSDSSPEEWIYRKSVNDGDVILIISGGNCECGCQLPTRNDRAEFIPGHDAKYKGKLIRAHLAGVSVTHVYGAVATQDVPINLACQRGWGYFIQQSEDALLRKQAKASTKKAKTAGAKPVDPGWVGSEVTFKDGRWERVGLVISEKPEDVEITYIVKGDGKFKWLPKTKVQRGDVTLDQEA